MSANAPVVVISGGTAGLGWSIAKELSPDHQVIILARNEEKLQWAAGELNCDYRVCDITNWQMVQATIDSIIIKYRHIDILINNAGVLVHGELVDTDIADIQRVFAVNFLGMAYLTKLVLPYMIERGEGKIINVGSQAGLCGKPKRSIYNASKWAVRGFTKSMQLELAPKGITVTGIYPGKMCTDLLKKAGCELQKDMALNSQVVAQAVRMICTTGPDVCFSELGIEHRNDVG